MVVDGGPGLVVDEATVLCERIDDRERTKQAVGEVF